MQDFLNDIIREHLGATVVILVFVISAFVYLVIWTMKIYYKVKFRIENLPCTKHEEKIDGHISNHGSMEANIARMATTIEFIQKSIDGLTQTIQSNNKNLADPFTQTHSPLSVTPLGMEMVEETGLSKMIDRNWESVNRLIEENATSMNPYDIQQFCIEQAVVYPERFLLAEDLDKIKMHAYTTGNSLTSYMKVVAVLARDRYFSEHGIDIQEVDANNPDLQKQ